MRASEFITERKKKRKKPRWAAYGPGPYGGYGYAVGYSGDSGSSDGGGGESIEYENFADGKGPGRPGDSQRHGIRKGASMAELEKAAKSKGRKGQLARWQINMRRGKSK
jgi:hypothetical protein